MEWGHEKNEKHPTRSRDIQFVHQCVRIQCVLSSLVCVGATLGFVPLPSLNHRLQRLDSDRPVGASLWFAAAHKSSVETIPMFPEVEPW
jgi:hypothetical protein